MKKSDKQVCVIYRGTPASPGVVIGKMFLLNRESIEVVEDTIPEGEVEREILEFKRALVDSMEERYSMRR